MNGSKKVLSVLAAIAAVSGAAIAVGRYLKKKGINIKEALDYKNNIFSEDEELQEDDYDPAQDQPLESPDEDDEPGSEKTDGAEAIPEDYNAGEPESEPPAENDADADDFGE